MLAIMQTYGVYACTLLAGGVHACITTGLWFTCTYYCSLVLYMLELLQPSDVHVYTTAGYWCAFLHYYRLVVCMLALL